MSAPTFETLIAAARTRNRKRDALDRANGFGAPGDGSVEEQVFTALLALECSIKLNDPESLAEAYCLLDDLRQQLHRNEKGIQA